MGGFIRGSRHGWRRSLAAALLAGITMVLVTGLDAVRAQEGRSRQGGRAEAEGGEAERPDPVCGRRTKKKIPGQLRHPRATLLLSDAADTAINFGGDRSPRVLRLDFTVDGCRFSKKDVEERESLDVEATLPVDESGDRYFRGALNVAGRIRSPHDVLVEVTLLPVAVCATDVPEAEPSVSPSASETASSSRHEAEPGGPLTVSSCALDIPTISAPDPSEAVPGTSFPPGSPPPSDDDEQRVQAGTYAGVIEVVDRRVNLTRVPFTVQVQFGGWVRLYFSVMIPAVAFGTFAAWFKSKDAAPEESYPDWWRNVRNLVGVGVGFAAARVAYEKGYFDDPDWGIDLPESMWLWPIGSTEWWALAVVVTTAFIGAMTPTTIGAEHIRKSRKKAEEDEAAKRETQGQVTGGTV